MTPLKYLSVARFLGPDAGEFLHAQLSADIAALEPGESTFACYCSPRGQVIGLLLVYRLENEYLVAGAAELLPAILARLKMFVLRSRVEFSVDPAAGLSGIDSKNEISCPGAFRPGGSDLRYLFTDGSAQSNGHELSFKAVEIRRNVTWLGPATSEKFIPQMLGFDQIGAVSFTKGCYPGQEIVARTRYLGKVKRKPIVIQIQESIAIDPAERVELCRGEDWSQGTVIDSAPGVKNTTLFYIVASAGQGTGPDKLMYREQSYRCATT